MQLIFMVKLAAFFCDEREGKQPTINCAAGYALVIKRSWVLKKKILGIAEAVARMRYKRFS